MPIDNTITKRLNEFLAKTDRTSEDVIGGATLLLQLNRNRQLFQTVMTNPKHFESTVVYELKKFVPIRQRGQTLEDVQNDARQLLGELKAAVNEEPAENDSKDDSEMDLPMHGGNARIMTACLTTSRQYGRRTLRDGRKSRASIIHVSA